MSTKSVNKSDININPSRVIKILISGLGSGFINEECRRMITAVNPNAKLQEITELVNADRKGDFTSKDKLDAQLAEAEARAKMIALSPYRMEALKGVVELMGDEDLPDNGEFSGGAVSDMVRSAVELGE